MTVLTHTLYNYIMTLLTHTHTIQLHNDSTNNPPPPPPLAKDLILNGSYSAIPWFQAEHAYGHMSQWQKAVQKNGTMHSKFQIKNSF